MNRKKNKKKAKKMKRRVAQKISTHVKKEAVSKKLGDVFKEEVVVSEEKVKQKPLQEENEVISEDENKQNGIENENSQDELVSAENVDSPSLKKSESRWNKFQKNVLYWYNLIVKLIESAVVIIVLFKVVQYVWCGVCMQEQAYLLKMYGLVEFINGNWKGCILFFLLVFIGSFIKIIRKIKRASAAGVAVETGDETSLEA